MTTYYVDDGGSNTSPYDTWVKAANALQTVLSIAGAGDIIKVETTHQELSSSSDIDLVGKSVNPAYEVVRVDSSASDTYDPTGVTATFKTTTGNYEIDLRQNITFYGLRFESNERFSSTSHEDEELNFIDCTFKLGINDDWNIIRIFNMNGCTLDSNDVSNSETPVLDFSSDYRRCVFRDVMFTGGMAYRQGIITGTAVDATFIGCDFSVMTRNPSYLVNITCAGKAEFIDCKLPPNYQALSASPTDKARVELIRCNGTNELELHTQAGSSVSEATIIRTGGADKSWETITTFSCGKNSQYFTNWIYAVADAAESKNFDIHFAYSGTQLTEEEIFMELEFMDSASTPYGTAVTSQKKAVLGDSVGNPNTASETWGGSETYEQYLRITETVGVANSVVRARIGIEKTSQTDEIYIDPYLEIS